MSDMNKAPVQQRKNIFMNRKFMYVFLISLLVYTLICGYILIFSGSLFFEAVIKGWWRSAASEYDTHSFLLGYLYGFPSLLGFVGGVSVLATSWKRFYKFKVLFFVPTAVWSTQLVLGNFRWGLMYWTEWLYLVPIMTLSIFVLYCVVNKVGVPILHVKTETSSSSEPSHAEVS